MRYQRVHVDAVAYELGPVVVTSEDLEERLEPLYARLRIPEGQLEALTGIVERRWWPPEFALSDGALAAARKALARCGMQGSDLQAVVYTGVCREQFEPATACRVAGELGVSSSAFVYDLSNACLGVLNGMVELANRIELGQIRAGMVVTCETAREIVEETIDRLCKQPSMEAYKVGLATLTGGSGAAAVILTDGSFGTAPSTRLLGGVARTAPEHHGLCRWGLQRLPGDRYLQAMATDSVAVLRYGVELGRRTWQAFTETLGWSKEVVDKVICHQVGSGHRDEILKQLGIDPAKDFSTFAFLGNMGTVSLPMTAALAAERGFLKEGDRVGFLGIGSGLNCLMLGLEW